MDVTAQLLSTFQVLCAKNVLNVKSQPNTLFGNLSDSWVFETCGSKQTPTKVPGEETETRMDSDGLPIVGPGIDLTKVPAINQKRTLAFLNHYVTHTVRFLNRFSCVCEEKLISLSTRIQRLETTLNILEAKLSSIPGLENVTVTSTSDTSETSQPQSNTGTQPISKSQEHQDTVHKADTADVVKEEVKPSKTVAQDSRYLPYFKMLKLGVPEMAVKQKMAFVGLNPDLLSTPDAPVSDGGGQDANSDSDFSGDESLSDHSSSGFSD